MKKKLPPKLKKEPVVNRELRKALDLFPKVVKQKEKAAREKRKTTKNFLSVKNQVYK